MFHRLFCYYNYNYLYHNKVYPFFIFILLLKVPPPNNYIKPEVKPVGIYKVKLQIGKHEFIGHGNTNQAARHDAALKALTQIKNEEKNENIKEVLKCIFKK